MFIENVTIVLLFCLDNGIIRTAGIHIHTQTVLIPDP